MKRTVIKKYTILSVLVSLFFSCSPQHKYAFKQFNTETNALILSIQGYVIKDSNKKENLKTNWNILISKMNKKPGFIEAYLSDGVGESKLILAHSKWKDLKSLRNAFSDKTILDLEKQLPQQQFEHLFKLGTMNTQIKDN